MQAKQNGSNGGDEAKPESPPEPEATPAAKSD
jgi:hypothetical protein